MDGPGRLFPRVCGKGGSDGNPRGRGGLGRATGSQWWAGNHALTSDARDGVTGRDFHLLSAPVPADLGGGHRGGKYLSASLVSL